VEEESLDDSISTLKTVASKKKTPTKLAMKMMTSSQEKKTTAFQEDRDNDSKDTTTVASQNTIISRLMEQVSIIKMENKQIID